MGGPEPAHLSFSYTKHQLCVCVGGVDYRGASIQRPQSTVAEESLLTQMPPSRTDVALCAQQGGSERYGVHSMSWPAQHARASLCAMHGLLADDNTPPTPGSMLGTSSCSIQLACAQRQLDLTMILVSAANREKNERTLPTTSCRFFPISL